MISEKLVKAFNDQIVAELWSSNLYLQMAFYLKKEGWNGSANWMFKQADERRSTPSNLLTTPSSAAVRSRSE